MPTAHTLAVLVVDDHASIRGLTRHGLSQIGVSDVVEAANGTEALAALGQKRFDLVIADWTMDGMDGLDLLARLRANPIIGRTPFILLTARNDADSVRTAIAAGVNNYIVKPFDVPTLRSKIEAVLGPLA
ncbi:response regulator [Insolitispirillum peregrinum]|uniref:Two-component system, chemotaxis family, response regulator CheY n=1 Tax=Insolitispirillum peregrinum TaxID=80876 RepID=A0A1N7PN55_9PROT|nr:response regulator [Insolitispirillum peregrinum]SIT11877.1 two-component system, chemotaxis family, response regulator CheY [Insolitispirillum peregrinum]